MTKTLDIIGQSRRDMLYKLISENYKTTNHFCTETGEDYAAIYKYLNKNVKMSDKVARRLEKAFNKIEGYFDQQIPKTSSVDIPVIDNVVEAVLTLPEILASSKKVSLLEQKLLDNYNWQKEKLFMIIINDNSMYPLIRDKSEVMVDGSQTEIEDNKIYAVKIKSNIYIRKLIKSPMKETIMLIPENKADFPTDEVSLANILVLGKVVYLKSIL